MKICLQSVPRLKMFLHRTGSRSWGGIMMSHGGTDSLFRIMSRNETNRMYSVGWSSGFFDSGCFRK